MVRMKPFIIPKTCAACLKTISSNAAADTDLGIKMPPNLTVKIISQPWNQNNAAISTGPSIYHYDLYRLQEPAALQKLDLQASLQSAVSLIEWPERLEKLTPGCRLDLHISVLSPVSTLP